jgi:hypothetical protein
MNRRSRSASVLSSASPAFIVLLRFPQLKRKRCHLAQAELIRFGLALLSLQAALFSSD